MAYIIISFLIIFIWLFGLFRLEKKVEQYDSPNKNSIEILHDDSVSCVSSIFMSSRTIFENTPSFITFSMFCKNELSLTEIQKETLKKDLYSSFSELRPFLSNFKGKLNETEIFCYILSLMDTDNKHCSELLNMSESSVRSCKSRLKRKLKDNALMLLYNHQEITY